MKTVRPAKGQLFCKQIDKETVTKSGLFIPDSSSTEPSIAEVINVGEGVPYEQKSRVVYKSYASHDIKLDGNEYMIIAIEDILGEVVDV